jgi:hypothetical protein
LHVDVTTSDKMMTLLRNGWRRPIRQCSKNLVILGIRREFRNGMAHASALRP